MRRIALASMSTLAAVVLMFGYRTSTPSPVSVATPSVAAAGGGADAATGSGSTTPAAPQSSPSAAGSSSSTVTGDVVETRWGLVQVAITVSGGKITAASAVQVPYQNRRDVTINARAVPVLSSETVTAQSAQIDSVSGATFTSDGYISSLQSALDKAGL